MTTIERLKIAAGVLGLMALLAGMAPAAPAPATYSVDLAWDAPTPTNGVSGYALYWGTVPGVYTDSRDVGNALAGSVTGLAWNVTYYYAATAYTAERVESEYSNVVVKKCTKPGRPTLKSVLLRLLGK